MAKKYLQLSEKEFINFQNDNSEVLNNGEDGYGFSLHQYNPFTDELLFEIEVSNEKFSKLKEKYNGVESDGKMKPGYLNSKGLMYEGSFVQEVDKAGNVSNKFLLTKDIKKNQTVLIRGEK